MTRPGILLIAAMILSLVLCLLMLRGVYHVIDFPDVTPYLE